ncbi:rCG27661 [Rattus norvegicus]|uniref:RCG27661 n=1 Tax=Rattus norvegicus TaxID=10116 RepID=A6KBW6_RAT|nr:rCG27661 [Rattus norvegicus]
MKYLGQIFLCKDRSPGAASGLVSSWGGQNGCISRN